MTGSVTNTSGTVRPGTSPGTLAVGGNYTQGAGGTLQTEVNGTTPGTQFDVIAVTGTATLNGTLAIVSGFTPALTDTFRIVTAATRTGEFSAVTGAQPGNSGTYTPRYDPDGVTLLMSTGPSPPPPPPAAARRPPPRSSSAATGSTTTTTAPSTPPTPAVCAPRRDESDETVGDLVLCGRQRHPPGPGRRAAAAGSCSAA